MRTIYRKADRPINWHELAYADIIEKLNELNGRLRDLALQTRLRIVRDEFGWDVIRLTTEASHSSSRQSKRLKISWTHFAIIRFPI